MYSPSPLIGLLFAAWLSRCHSPTREACREDRPNAYRLSLSDGPIVREFYSDMFPLCNSLSTETSRRISAVARVMLHVAAPDLILDRAGFRAAAVASMAGQVKGLASRCVSLLPVRISLPSVFFPSSFPLLPPSSREPLPYRNATHHTDIYRHAAHSQDPLPRRPAAAPFHRPRIPCGPSPAEPRPPPPSPPPRPAIDLSPELRHRQQRLQQQRRLQLRQRQQRHLSLGRQRVRRRRLLPQRPGSTGCRDNNVHPRLPDNRVCRADRHALGRLRHHDRAERVCGRRDCDADSSRGRHTVQSAWVRVLEDTGVHVQ